MKTLTPLMLLAFLGLALFSACGDGEDPGSGTQTLLVDAQVNMNNQIDNATDDNDFDTQVRVEVKRGDVAVSDATVTIKDEKGVESQLQLLDEGQGQYGIDLVGYRASFSLNVEAGEDNVRGAFLNAPDIHVITAPEAGAQVPAETDLEVSWSREDAADSASIESKKMQKIEIEDSGNYTISASDISGRPDSAQSDHVTIWRSKRVGLVGGLGGSELSISIRNQVEFQVLPTD